MILNNIIGISACALMYFSHDAKSYEMVIVGRILVGISCGRCLLQCETNLTILVLADYPLYTEQKLKSYI